MKDIVFPAGNVDGESCPPSAGQSCWQRGEEALCPMNGPPVISIYGAPAGHILRRRQELCPQEAYDLREESSIECKPVWCHSHITNQINSKES